MVDDFEATASQSSTVRSNCSSPDPLLEEFKAASQKNIDEMEPSELKKEVTELREALGKAIRKIETMRTELDTLRNTKENNRAGSGGASEAQSRQQSPPGPAHNDAANSKPSERGDLEVDSNFQNRYWTQEEHQRFLQALKIFGHKDVRAIAEYVGSRNTTQIRTHAQKYFKKLEAKGQKLSDLGIPDRPAKSNPSPSNRRGSLKHSRDSSPFSSSGPPAPRSRKNSISGETTEAVPSLPAGAMIGFGQLNIGSFPGAGRPAAATTAAANPLLINLLQQQQLHQPSLLQHHHQLLQQHLQRQQVAGVSGVDVLALAALTQMQQTS
mmetsp:Transcript_9858/g.15423  ORF Transcript_9858/g.15423 Transcript_9858/m.15423 type:complete len:325 (-) Transcript_9858:134-1108(-)